MGEPSCPSCRRPSMPYGTCHACGRRWGSCSEASLSDTNGLSEAEVAEGIRIRLSLDTIAATSEGRDKKDLSEELFTTLRDWTDWRIPREVQMLEAVKESVTLRAALEELVTLSTHYAELLNMHDGGARRGFKNADAWIARLKEIE